MGPELEKRIARLAADHESGASEILAEVIGILRDVLATGADVTATAQAICRAQPMMAPVWNAAIAALASRDRPERFMRFAERVKRAPDALARFAIEHFREGAPLLQIATISYSGTVVDVVGALARVRPVRVACSESRPALEGRKLAARLAALGVPVTFYSDAAIGHALGAVDAVLVGADAVAPAFFLNKSGTRMLAAAASTKAVPFYVVASRDKFINHAIARLLQGGEGDPAEVWGDAPAGVTVRNPYFEWTPLDLTASVITDVGVLGAGSVPDLCNTESAEVSESLVQMFSQKH
jgi:translation initiation factor 2B subunit (eIF-2B alpha/beta/delta family)